MAAADKRGGRTLLAGYEGVDHIKKAGVQDDEGWSLEQFFGLGSERQQPTQFTPPCEETVVCPGKATDQAYFSTSTATRTAYTWTEAVIKDWQET